MRYIWLVYLGALFFQPAFDPAAGLVDWFAAVALIAVFLPLYVAGHRAADDRQPLLIVAAMAALASGRFADQRRCQRLRHLCGRHRGVYRADAARGLVIAALVGVLVLILAMSTVPLPWRVPASYRRSSSRS